MVGYLRSLLAIANGALPIRFEIRNEEWRKGNLIAVDEIGIVVVYEQNVSSAIPWSSIGVVDLGDVSKH